MRFAQRFIIPRAMANIGEPTNSLLAGYTAPEMLALLSVTPFKQHRIKQGPGWLFVWGRKD